MDATHSTIHFSYVPLNPTIFVFYFCFSMRKNSFDRWIAKAKIYERIISAVMLRIGFHIACS
jgi:uncharacterized membrane protein YbaN (DUF454 family)